MYFGKSCPQLISRSTTVVYIFDLLFCLNMDLLSKRNQFMHNTVKWLKASQAMIFFHLAYRHPLVCLVPCISIDETWISMNIECLV